ncbi:MAG: choice-of-anchor Q domain-containing protein [Rhodanobacter sp.]
MHQILSRSVAGGGSLASLVSAALMMSAALPVNIASAATIHVMNCNDSGVGSLRGSVASALSGDTLDLTTLPCSRIVLTSGQITVPQYNLTLKGPGSLRLTVDGNHASRVFQHTGAGMLSIKSMSIANGHIVSSGPTPLGGGCILSSASIELNAVQVHHCAAIGRYSSSVRGGGVGANSVRLLYSRVFSNAATAGSGGGVGADYVVVYASEVDGNSAVFGGGIFGYRAMSASYSAIHDNTASSGGGGVASFQDLVINKSTVSGNRSLKVGGGIWANTSEVPRRLLADSTFSGNRAAYGAGVFVAGGFTTVTNSTIAFNQENPGSGEICFGGLMAFRLHMDSSIVGRNTCNGVESDINQETFQVHGANNLVQQSTTTLPADTISADPLLAPLADNGGPTQTHALLNGSPAIDRGNNFRHRLYDQRGPGFVRVKGTSADIGAFEH